jgi:hypothetical protein
MVGFIIFSGLIVNSQVESQAGNVPPLNFPFQARGDKKADDCFANCNGCDEKAVRFAFKLNFELAGKIAGPNC